MAVRVTLNEKDIETINLAFDILLSDYEDENAGPEILKDVTKVLEKIAKAELRKNLGDRKGP